MSNIYTLDREILASISVDNLGVYTDLELQSIINFSQGVINVRREVGTYDLALRTLATLDLTKIDSDSPIKIPYVSLWGLVIGVGATAELEAEGLNDPGAIPSREEVAHARDIISSAERELDNRDWLSSRGHEESVDKDGDIGNDENAFKEPLLRNKCFLPGTPISMWSAPDKPIEAVAVGDLVVSYDRRGGLVPGRVSRVFRNEVRVVLDLFGLMVTPGHVTLCGEGPHAGCHVPVLDILRSDGALVMRDGSHVRAATGCAVGSEGDAWVVAVVGEPRGGGRVHVTEARPIRAGTRVILADGRDVSVLELIRAAGGEVGADGWVRPEGQPEAEGKPYLWAFSDHLPLPEDHVLARSGTTLADIYAAGEWEAFDSGAFQALGIEVFHGADRADRVDVDASGKFENNLETLRIDRDLGVRHADDVLARARHVGDDVVIDFGQGDVLMIENATKGQLANDLIVA